MRLRAVHISTHLRMGERRLSVQKRGLLDPRGDRLLSQLLWDTLVGEGDMKVSGRGGGKEY